MSDEHFINYPQQFEVNIPLDTLIDETMAQEPRVVPVTPRSSIDVHDDVYGEVNWDRLERLLWQDTKTTKLTIETVEAESSTLWIVRFHDDTGATFTGADWSLDRAIVDALKNLDTRRSTSGFQENIQ